MIAIIYLQFYKSESSPRKHPVLVEECLFWTNWGKNKLSLLIFFGYTLLLNLMIIHMLEKYLYAILRIQVTVHHTTGFFGKDLEQFFMDWCTCTFLDVHHVCCWSPKRSLHLVQCQSSYSSHISLHNNRCKV